VTGPRYPIYIPSKGRWQYERRLTVCALEALGIPYRIVVEEQEADDYRAAVDPAFGTILVLDPAYQREYDTCDSEGDAEGRPKGSGPARNFIWDHAAAEGAGRHWVVDDNIHAFYRFQRNLKTPSRTGAIFRAMEDFVDRYENVAMAGPNYFMFVSRKEGRIQPFTPNTRIYSCNLIDTAAPYRWRGRYNEDTDLSLRMLKDGRCTILFNAFLQEKAVTQSIKGGNTDTIYINGTLDKSRLIARLHPDVARVVWKFNRWHHHVDYRPFRNNRLIRRDDVVIPDGPNEYGMRLTQVS
jgi:hypothetical protein